MVIGTTILVGGPGGRILHSEMAPEGIDLVQRQLVRTAFGAPIPTLLLTISPVAANRWGVRLSSSALDPRGSNFGCSFWGGLGLNLGRLSSGFTSAFLARTSFRLSVSRRILLDGLRDARCGSDCFFSGVGGFGSATRRPGRRMNSVLAILAAGSSGGLARRRFRRLASQAEASRFRNRP
jgi:hypothetical protein